MLLHAICAVVTTLLLLEMSFVFLGNRRGGVKLVQARLMSLSRAGRKALKGVKGTNCCELLQWGRLKQCWKGVKDGS